MSSQTLGFLTILLSEQLLASTVYTADNTGSLMKTATVCRVKYISVVVLSVEMAQSTTRHLKWARTRLRWTFVYFDGHYENLFGTWASLNHQISTSTPSLFTSSAFTSITHTFTLSGDHDLLPSVFVQISARIYQNPRKSKANNTEHGQTNSPPLCRNLHDRLDATTAL